MNNLLAVLTIPKDLRMAAILFFVAGALFMGVVIDLIMMMRRVLS